MKNILIILILISVSSLSNAQSRSSFSVKAPNQANQIDNNSIKSYEAAKYRTHSLRNDPSRHYYAVDDVTIGYWEIPVNKQSQKSLNARVAELKELHALSPKSPAEISVKAYNGINYIVDNYQVKGISYIYFFSEYNNDKMVSGVIQYNPSDKQKATTAFDDFLTGIQKNN